MKFGEVLILAMNIEFMRFYWLNNTELNPIERVWKLTRRLRLYNQFFPTLDILRNEVENLFRQ